MSAQQHGHAGGLPPGTRAVLDERTSLRANRRIVLGGAPWRLTRVAPPVMTLLARLQTAGPAGDYPDGTTERAALDLLIDRGLAHPVAEPRPLLGEVAVVIPAYGRDDLLARCLQTVRQAGLDVVVVDDGSPDAEAVSRVVAVYGARLIRHDVNQGPAAARNSGLAATTAPIVAFIDSDCTVAPGWLEALVPLFDDLRVAAVAPRVRPEIASKSLLSRHEDARSALDMGLRRRLVRPGAALGFLPSATMLLRREALQGKGFDPDMRVGEDVDLVWRLAEAGWHLRYEPTITVRHAARLQPWDWARRRYDYGTSAADLDVRHPGLLTPVRVSAWNLATAALLVAGRPRAAAVVAATATLALTRRLDEVGGGPALAGSVVAKGFVADAAAVGHALRREWWPLGWLAITAAHRSRVARAATSVMLAPVALEWLRERPAVDPGRYALLRLVEDAAYGSGVIVSGLRRRRPGVLLPEIRMPRLPVRGQPGRQAS
jgi:mycofactocin glycosyltransferase